jgi:hypothetical protein
VNEAAACSRRAAKARFGEEDEEECGSGGVNVDYDRLGCVVCVVSE